MFKLLATCSSITDLSNGLSNCSSGSSTNGEICQVDCNDGYSLVGSSTITCNGHTGLWEPDIGKCELSCKPFYIYILYLKTLNLI